jgi:hypothetical protein
MDWRLFQNELNADFAARLPAAQASARTLELRKAKFKLIRHIKAFRHDQTRTARRYIPNFTLQFLEQAQLNGRGLVIVSKAAAAAVVIGHLQVLTFHFLGLSGVYPADHATQT